MNPNQLERVITNLNLALADFGGHCFMAEPCLMTHVSLKEHKVEDMCGPCTAYWHLLQAYKGAYAIKQAQRDAVVQEIIIDC